MQKFAIISDIHANFAALQPVLELIENLGVDKIICLGDIISYGPQPAECIDALRRRKVSGVMGNHDAAVVGQVELVRFPEKIRRVLSWTRELLSDEDIEYLSNFPLTDKFSWGRMVHASPHNELWHYIKDIDTAFYIFRMTSERIICTGHSHRPHLFSSAKLQIKTKPVRVKKGEEDFHNLRFSLDAEHRYLLNPGSVGQPRDGDPRASFLILEIEEEEPVAAVWYRIHYNIDKVEKMISSLGLPLRFASRLYRGQ